MSELQQLYWTTRFVDGEPQLSRTHLVPEDKRTALCGRSLPRGDHLSTIQTDEETEYNRNLCQRCVLTRNRLAREKV